MFRRTLALACVFMTIAGASNAQIINTLRGFEDHDQGWSGSIAGAVALADGNDNYFELEGAAALQYQGQHNRWRLILSGSRRQANNEKVSDNRIAHLRHNYRLLDHIASIAFVQTQYNPFRRIERRTLVGLGARFDAWRGERLNASVGATVMYEEEQLTDNDAGFDTGYRYSMFVSVFGDRGDELKLDVLGFYQPVTNDLTDYRALTIGNLRVALIGSLDVLLNYRFEHDSKPAPGVKNDDHTLRSGLELSF